MTCQPHENWEEELSKAAQRIGVNLPEFDEEDQTWVKDNKEFKYMIDGIWTEDEILDKDPDELVQAKFNTPFTQQAQSNDYSQELKYFVEKLNQEFEADEVKASYGPKLIDNADLILEIPISRINEIESVEVEVPEASNLRSEGVTPSNENDKYSAKYVGLFGTPEPAKNKQKDYMNALLDLFGIDMELNYDMLSRNKEGSGIPEQEIREADGRYGFFLEDLRRGNVIDRSVYDNLSP